MKIYLGGIHIGNWLIDGQEQGFSYLEQWLQSAQAYPLSQSMPLSIRIYTHQEALPYLANLLPHGDLLSELSHQTGFAEENAYSLLGRMGRDCPGAVSFRPEGCETENGTYYELQERSMHGMLLHARRRTPLINYGVSSVLPGSHPKIQLYQDSKGVFYLPRNGSPSNVILKLPGKEGYDSLLNEILVMTLAGMAGLPTVKCSWQRSSSDWCQSPYILMERYDRRMAKNGTVKTIHQEDMCQILGIMPRQRFVRDGGPAPSAISDIIRQSSTNPVEDLEMFFKWMVFNTCIGNVEAHGKKLSLFYYGTSVRLAPFYGLRSDLGHTKLERLQLGFPVGRQDLLTRLGKDDWKQLGDLCHLIVPSATALVGDLTARISACAQHLLDKGNLHEAQAKILDCILQNCRRIGSCL